MNGGGRTQTVAKCRSSSSKSHDTNARRRALPFRGGAEYCLDTMLRELNRLRFDATVIFPAEGPMTELARSYGYKLYTHPFATG